MEQGKKQAKTQAYKKNSPGPLPVATGHADDRTEAEPFTSGISTVQAVRVFSAEFMDEQECRTWLLRQVHPRGAVCPACASRVEEVRRESAFWLGKKLHCKVCGSWFTALTGTPLTGSKLSFRQIYLLAVLAELMATGLTSASVADMVGVSADTVRFWVKKFKILIEVA